MSRLRILHLGKFYPPVRGGMETVLQTLCRGELRAVQTRALVMNRSRKTTHDVVDGVPVTRVASLLTVGAVAVAPTLPLWLARAEADLLVLHEPNPMALLAYFVARPRAPLIIWYHSEVVRPGWRYRLFYRPLLEFALRRVVAHRRRVSTDGGRSGADALIARSASSSPTGWTPIDISPRPRCAARADALRERAGGPILLFVGRLVPYKGLDVLLRALPGLDAQMVIVGDGPLRGALETMVRELGIGDRVHLAGEVTDEERLAWLHACAALVLPSTTRQEAFGMVQLEAMLCGRPVVSTDLPTGVPWVNVHGETASWFVPATLPRCAARSTVWWPTPTLRHALGAAARARVLKHVHGRQDVRGDAGALPGSVRTDPLAQPAGGRRSGRVDGGNAQMRPAHWLRRSARAVRELALRIATHGRGVPRTLNGLAVRVDPGTRPGFLVNYERPVAAFLRQHIVAGSEVWNVGANIGVYALQLGAWVGPDGRVLAFEPNPFAARLLTENVRLNGLHDRVEILRLAIGESPGEADLHARASGPHESPRPPQPRARRDPVRQSAGHDARRDGGAA